MATKTQQTEGKPIGYKELIKAREEEMQRDILPGLMTTVRDPGTSNHMVNVYSGTALDRMSKALTVVGKED